MKTVDTLNIEKIIQTIHQEDQKTFREKFLDLHPSDQVDLFVTLNSEERQRVYTYLSPKEFSVIFSELYFIDQRACSEELSNDYFSEVLNEMFTDNVVSFLNRIDEEERQNLLNKMNSKKAEYVELVLSQDMQTAGAIMTNEYVTVKKETTAREALELIRQQEKDAEIVYYVYVTDEENILEGIISLKRLIALEPDEKIETGMTRSVITVSREERNLEVGKVIQKYDLLAVPVVSEEHRLVGVITVDDVMDIIEAHTIKEFGEFSTVKDADDTESSAFKNARKRAPWIIFLMFAGLITGGVIGRFEDTLESVVVLAAFMPMLMDSGGNVGTQSLAVSVRELALGNMDLKNFWKRIFKEMTTGFLIGFVCMILIAILIFILYRNLILGIIVGVSILLTLTISAVIGLVFPIILDKLKFDPAIASGPFITTINDVVGLLIYFSIATTFMEYL